MFKVLTLEERAENNNITHKRKNSGHDDVGMQSKRYVMDDAVLSNTTEHTFHEERREPSPIVIFDWLQTFKSMPNNMQAEALSDLVGLCSSSHVKHLQNIIAPHFQKDFINILPRELSLKIVSYLSPADLVRVAQLSSAWRRLAEDKLLWAEKCQEREIAVLLPPNNGLLLNWQILANKRRHKLSVNGIASDLVSPPFALLDLPSLDDEAEHPFSFCQSQFRRALPFGSRTKVLSQMDPDGLQTRPSTSTWVSSHSFSSSSLQARRRFTPFLLQDDETSYKKLESCLSRCKYKAIYLRDRRIYNNWRKRRVAAACELRGHDEHVITCMRTTVGSAGVQRIVTGSDDHMLRVWSVATAECERVLAGHTGGVWTLQLSVDGVLAISGSTDRTVRVWNIDNGMCIHTLNGHTSTVRCMALNDDVLVTGSRDCTIRIWDVCDGLAIRTLYGHLAAVRCVQFDGRRIISGGYDHNLIVWDAQTGAQIHVLSGHANRVYSLLYESERNLAVSGSLDTTIRVWDVNTGECLQTLVGHQSLTSGIQLFGDMLVSANADSTIKMWNILDGQCTHTLAGPNRHLSAVTSLQVLKNGLIISSGDDGTVKLWDIKQGAFLCDLLKLETGGQGGCVWRIKATPTMLICAVGSRNSTEDTKLILMDFDAPYP